MACRFPGARDPAEFHDLAVAGRDMFQPVAAPLGAHVLAARCGGGGRALQTGELDLAVAGGAELGLDPVWLALQGGMVVLVRGRCPDGTADARRGGSRPFRAGPRRGGRRRPSGNPARSVT
jgi:hypothetical protein